jgi:hypothetical protein
MIVLLNQLEIPEDEKAVLEIKKSITLETYTSATLDELNEIYRIVSDFLNRLYLKEFKIK